MYVVAVIDWHSRYVLAWQLSNALDNVFCERLWRSLKYEKINLNRYATVRKLHAGLSPYFDFYNHERPHQSPDCRTPAEERFVLCSEPAAFV